MTGAASATAWAPRVCAAVSVSASSCCPSASACARSADSAALIFASAFATRPLTGEIAFSSSSIRSCMIWGSHADLRSEKGKSRRRPIGPGKHEGPAARSLGAVGAHLWYCE